MRSGPEGICDNHIGAGMDVTLMHLAYHLRVIHMGDTAPGQVVHLNAQPFNLRTGAAVQQNDFTVIQLVFDDSVTH